MIEILALAAQLAITTGDWAAVHLPIPAYRQAPERCGPAAVGTVLRYYDADSAALAEIERAYDPALRGALITDLAARARTAGYAATIETPHEDSLQALLRAGVPPVLLYERGVGPVSRKHFGVLVGWDPARHRYWVNDGSGSTRLMRRDDLMRRWSAAGGRALIVRPLP